MNEKVIRLLKAFEITVPDRVVFEPALRKHLGLFGPQEVDGGTQRSLRFLTPAGQTQRISAFGQNGDAKRSVFWAGELRGSIKCVYSAPRIDVKEALSLDLAEPCF